MSFSKTIFINELLQVLSPGRRKLKQKQQSLQLNQERAQAHLINEFQSLASLVSRKCTTARLRVMDHEEFRHFLSSAERLDSWEQAESEIHKFSLPEMTGGVNPGDQRLVFHLIEYLRPTRVLEIGTHIGASTIHAAAALKRFCGDRGPSLVSVDIIDVNCSVTKPWRKFGSMHSPRNMIEQLRCTELVSFVNSPSVEFLEQVQEKYDLIFLDGDHSAQSVYREIPLALDRLASNGCILLHDYFPHLKPLWETKSSNMVAYPGVIPGVYLAVQRFLKEGCDFVVEPLGELPWKTKLNSQVTSMALLSRLPFEK